MFNFWQKIAPIMLNKYAENSEIIFFLNRSIGKQ